MSNEIEVKFAVAGFDGIKKSLHDLPARYLQTVLLTDTYYDTPQRTLLSEDAGIRIREVKYLRSAVRHTREHRPQLTYKGPGHGGTTAKIRREVQTHVDCPEAIDEILRACGLEMTLRIQKRRTTYKARRCVVELDELPIIGSWVEVEGPDEKTVLAKAQKLGLTGPPIKDHYIDLLTAAEPEVGRSIHELIFEPPH